MKHHYAFHLPEREPLPEKELQERIFGFYRGPILKGTAEYRILEQAQELYQMGGLSESICERLREAYQQDIARHSQNE